MALRNAVSARFVSVVVSCLVLLGLRPLRAQEEDVSEGDSAAAAEDDSETEGAPAEEPLSPEERVALLEAQIASLAAEQQRLAAANQTTFAPGLLTIGGTRFLLGGTASILLIDAESGEFPGVIDGATIEPDPHLEMQRLRLEPIFELNRHISLRGQLDLRPTDGDTSLRELTAEVASQPTEWLGSLFQIGLDDRFIRLNRRSKTYPLIGTAFWRDESVALTWRLTFGGDTVVDTSPEDDAAAGARRDAAIADSAAATGGPFDFANDWGRARLHLSLGQGYEIGTDEVQSDEAGFDQIVADTRNVEEDLSLRELGIGLGYRRNFQLFGDLEFGTFYYNDELRDISVAFLQQELTLRTPGGDPAAPPSGYGDSDSRTSYRYGAFAGYFLPASSIMGAIADTRRNDGLRLLGQFINGEDGELERKGWFGQVSYRVSFGRLLLDRYFRSLEPLVRFGALNINLDPVPELPGTWDRKEIVVGAILEVTGDIFIKAEYGFHDEDTGGPSSGRGPGSVDNDELLVELLLRF